MKSKKAFPEPLDTLSDMQLMVLEHFIETVHYEKNATLFLTGDETDGCYIIDDGIVRLEIENTNSDPDDRDDVLAFVEPGSIIGELSLLDGLPRSASAFAHSNVTARRISVDAFRRLTAEFPQIGLDLVKALGRVASIKLRSTTQRLDSMISSRSDKTVEEMIAKAEAAQLEIMSWSEGQIDALLYEIATQFAAQAEEFARAAVEETGIGNVKDKTLKNQIASIGVYESIRGRTGYGLLVSDGASHRILDIASPVGIVFGLVPVTNPTSTFIFKTLIALKARNALILSPNRKALMVCNRVGELVQSVLDKQGAPPNVVQWIKQRNTRKQVVTFMNHKKVGLVLATGGSSMVKAAYSSGNPAIGVGSGNAPTLICDDADLKHAAVSVVQSKSFDNGLICGSEHNLVVMSAVYEDFVKQLDLNGAAVLTADEIERFYAQAVDSQKEILQEVILGRHASEIAEMCAIKRPHDIQLIVVPRDRVSPEDPLSREKMAPVLSLFRVDTLEEGFQVCRALLDIDGTGHTAIIHTHSEQTAQKFGVAMPVSRILVNSPGAHGVVGLTTYLTPSLTLGCGTFGRNSTTDNVTYTHMMNVKRLAFYSPERMAHMSELI